MASYSEYYIMGPLVNSFLLTFGPTTAPMDAAAIGWSIRGASYAGVALEVNTTMALSHAVWQGLSQNQWETRYLLYARWAAETAEKSLQMAAHCKEASAAWTTAFTIMPSFAAVLANRVLYETLNILNIATLGLFAIIIVPIMMTLDFEYLLMRVAAASAMSLYASLAQQLNSTLPNFTFAPRITLFPFGFTDGPEYSVLSAIAGSATVAVNSVEAVIASTAATRTIPQPPDAPHEPAIPENLDPLFITLPQPGSPTASATVSNAASATAQSANPAVTFTRVAKPIIPLKKENIGPELSRPTLTTNFLLTGKGKDLLSQSLRTQTEMRNTDPADSDLNLVLDQEEKKLAYTEVPDDIGFNEDPTIDKLLELKIYMD